MTATNSRARVLAAMPGTQRDIRNATGLGVGTVSRWVTAIKEAGQCHIGAWVSPGKAGRYTEYLQPGPGPNASRDTVSRIRHPKVARRHNLGMRVAATGDHRPARVPYWVNLPASRCPMTTALFGVGAA